MGDRLPNGVLWFDQKRSREGMNHEAEMMSMGGASDSVGSNNAGDVRDEDLGNLEESSREAEESSNAGGGSGDDGVNVAVEMIGKVA